MNEKHEFDPWNLEPLNGWDIVGMNHYSVHGRRMLFVAMTKDGKCIKEEGYDDEAEDMWDRLWHEAVAADKVSS